MAQALDVSEMWLAGYDAPMERSPEQKKMDELAKLIHKLRKNEKLQSVCVNISMLDDDQLDAVDRNASKENLARKRGDAGTLLEADGQSHRSRSMLN